MDIWSDLFSACAALRELFDAEGTCVTLVSADGATVEAVAADGLVAAATVGSRMPITEGVTGFVARTAQPVAVDDLGADGRWCVARAAEIGCAATALIAAPLLDREEVCFGVVTVLDPGEPGGAPVAEACTDLEMLVLAAAQISDYLQSNATTTPVG